ncbi:VOC family protein [Modestobacter sp. NPDC049651]|uniref:VOC family protein n=1 Tax=unclassified Modestobacter TaxID=2643866 RepID=UPI0033E39787
MTIATTTHLNFRGEARAALEHYQAVFGGDLAVVTYADAGAVTDPAEADQVTWGQVAGDGFRVMAYDVPAAQPFDRGTNSFFVSVRGETAEEVAGCWARLAEGAEVVVPFGPAQWSPAYGMLRDRFGVTWVLDVAVQYAAS